MLKNILLIITLVVALSFSANAKEIGKASFSASMESKKCSNKIEKVLKKTDGIEKVNVNLKEQTIMVEYDKSKIDESQIASAINKAKPDAYQPKEKSADAKKSCSAKCNKPCGGGGK